MEQEPEGGACLNPLTFTTGLGSIFVHGTHPALHLCACTLRIKYMKKKI